MALKKKITKAEYDALSKAHQELYSGDGDEYVLDVEDMEDNGALKRALDRERAEKKAAKDKLKAAEDAAQAAEEERQRKEGDIAKIEESWKKKLDKATNDGNTRVAQLESHLRSILVDAKAMELAAKISTSPALLVPHIKARLQADLSGDKPVTRVLDADGNVSDMTIEGLEKFFTNNKEFAPIIIGSKASGAGSGGHRSGGSTSGKKASEYSETERVELYRTDPAEFQRVFGKL
ncbi:MAG: hypothetical protein WAN50_00330 [Minisyncoccia bacterium]